MNFKRTAMIVIAGIALSVCFVAGVPLAPMARWAGVALVTAAVLALAAPYRRTRVFGFLDPWSDPLDQGRDVGGGPVE